jgi:hypothetical protein
LEPSLKTFLICAYPRSRTLWLANFFSVPSVSFCEHEATQWAGSSEDFWARADTCPAPVYGNSDSANILVLPALLARRPLTKVVWIERPMSQVALSMRKAGFPFTQAGAEMLSAHKERYRNLFDLELDFRELGRFEIISALWNFLLPGQPFDCGRWGQLEAAPLALSWADYQTTPRQVEGFLRFLSNEGDTDLLQRK